VAVTGATFDLTKAYDATVLPSVAATNGRIALFDPTLSLLTSVKPDGSARRVIARCRRKLADPPRAFVLALVERSVSHEADAVPQQQRDRVVPDGNPMRRLCSRTARG